MVYKSLTKGLVICSNSRVFAGCDNVVELTAYLPSGLIVMWSGTVVAIPLGWLLCDGQNGTPDLRNRFIVGAGSIYEVGDIGGSDNVSLTVNQLPSHNHSASSLTCSSAGSHTHSDTFSINLSGLRCSSAGEHTHTFRTSRGESSSSSNVQGRGSSLTQTETTSSAGSHTHTISGSGSLSGSIRSGGEHTHTVSGSISNTGGNQAHENRPPYYALCFIMKE